MQAYLKLRKVADHSRLFRSYVLEPYVALSFKALRRRIKRRVKKREAGMAITDLLKTMNSLTPLIGIDLETWKKYQRKAADLCQSIYSKAKVAAQEPQNFGDDFTLVLSYPRSGNTFLLNVIGTGGCYVLQPPGVSVSYSPYCVPVGLDRPCLVKDHDPREGVYFDRIIYAIRDGRNALISLAFMVSRQKLFDIRSKDQLPAFIKYLNEEYKYRDWASNVRAALALRDRGAPTKFLLTRYEDFTRNPSDAIGFVFPNLAEAQRAALFASGAKSAEAAYRIPEWGGGFETNDPNDLYFGWHESRGGDYWKKAFTPEAKRAFHETGATELLLEFGYENDPNWWRN